MEIAWLSGAIADLSAIQDFIGADNPRAARLTTGKIDSAVRLLADQPSLGRPGRVAKTRELAVPGTPYVVAYTVVANSVTILAVLHGARRWPSSF